jgi:hypothetical protein
VASDLRTRPTRRRGRRFHGDAGAREKGYVLALTALLLLPLLAFTGFAVDLGSWAALASKAQTASDAAALAGVVYLPDLPNTAIAKAEQAAERNGYKDGVNGVTVTVTPNERNELRVEIFDPEVKQYFSSIFVQDPSISRSATAEFIRPVPMGSPQAALGQDPERGFNPFFVLNTAGWATNKQNGDKRTAGQCGGSFAGCTPSNSAAGENTDYSEDGYYFTIDVDDTRPLGNPLSIEVYDPAYVYNDDGCGTNQISAAQATTLQTNHPGDPYALQRYASGRTQWCTGDQNLTATGANNGSAIVTTYIVREPDNTPSDVTDNPAVCAISFDPYGNPGQGSTAWINAARTGGNGIFDFLNSNANRGRENVRFRDHYRKWFPVCTVPSGSVVEGDYILQVRTNADLSSPLYSTTASLAGSAGSLENADDPYPVTGGHNRYMLRTGWGTTLSTPSGTTFTGVSLSGLGHLPIYMNQIPAGGATAEFYLARITPETAGKTLQLTFWDMADISGGSATFQLLSPNLNATEATAAALDTCSFSRDGTTPPPGVTVSGCTVSGITSANYNGRNMVVRIPIPGDYSCEVTNPLGCWTKVRVSVVGAGATPSDTTTWSATMTGDPVRLIR